MPYDKVDDITGLTQSQANKLTNAQLKTALMTMVYSDCNNPSDAVLLEEIRDLYKDTDQINWVEQEVTVHSQVGPTLNIIHQLQLFLESRFKRSSKNLIITGIPQDVSELGSNNQQKIKTLLDKIRKSDGMIVFITLFRYFIKLFYSFKAFLFLFLTDADSIKGTLCPFCVPIHKKKKSKAARL